MGTHPAGVRHKRSKWTWTNPDLRFGDVQRNFLSASGTPDKTTGGTQAPLPGSLLVEGSGGAIYRLDRI
ncbi:hypothetical protein Ais01nite_84950 [Asanoa ishikariensis]|nr:hypothetical protein Ais01nite_84950 [Asanoa ishikariensis]